MQTETRTKDRSNGYLTKQTALDLSSKSGLSKKRKAVIARRVQQAVQQRSDQYPDVNAPPPSEHSSVDGQRPVIRPLPRRRQLLVDEEVGLGPAQFQTTAIVNAGLLQTLRRLLVWFSAIIRFVLATLWDIIRRRDSELRRAVRLRLTMEHAGGTLLKIGQQMSIRMDVLPTTYCNELSKMLDRVPPYPTSQAIASIERTTGRPLEEIFSAFDPEPIGSASIACVYQAVLRETGERVAIKVKRPGIDGVFAADFRVLDWLLGIGEALTIFRPDFSTNLRKEIRQTLTGELDFKREARLQEIFERRARQSRKNFFRAPRVHHQFSGHDVIVEEYVSGMWLSEILVAVEQGNQAGLQRMRELNIDPKKVARRLLFVLYWGFYENIAFHADPHPANIVVQANSKVTFIDFGASGSFNQSRRNIYRRFYESQLNEDVWGMVQTILVFSEPLPLIDVNQFAKDVEASLYEHLLAMKSKNTPWYERTTASMWIAFFKLVRQYNLPAPKDILLIARASLLYDSLAARLDPSIDYYKEYHRYAQVARRGSRDRFWEGIRSRLANGGLSDHDYEMIEILADTGSRALYRLQRFLSVPYDFMTLPFAVEKGVFAILRIARFVVFVFALTAIWLIGDTALRLMDGESLDMVNSLAAISNQTAFQVIVLLFAVITLRQIIFRWNEKIRTS